uniref:Uncharacterized protein n=1 Tax=Ciona intestinalis TaxID=7719 RepID=H2Y1D4_CIOIN
MSAISNKLTTNQSLCFMVQIPTRETRSIFKLLGWTIVCCVTNTTLCEFVISDCCETNELW